MKKYLKYLSGVFRHFFKMSLAMIVLQCAVTFFGLISPVLLQMTVDDGIVKKDADKLFIYSAASIVCLMTLNGARYLYSKLSVRQKTRQSLELKTTIMDNLAKGDLNFFNNNPSGDILKTLESDVSILEEISVSWLITTLIELLGALAAAVWILKINYMFLMIVAAAEALIILFQKKFVSVLSKNAVVLRGLGGRSMGYMKEYVSNMISSIYGKTTVYMRKRFTDNETEYTKKLSRQYDLAQANQLISNTIGELLNISIYLIGGIFVIGGSMSYGELIAFSQYIALIMSPVMIIINSFSKIQLAIVSLDKVNGLTDMPAIESGDGRLENYQSLDIRFKDVSLGYEDDEILRDVNIELRSGRTYAFVGENGCGKSTILKAIYRMIDAVEGDISVCGENIAHWDIDELRREIGIVSQDVFVLNDTIYNNLALGREIDDDEIKKVMEIADLSEFISSRENGIHSMVGENGASLSGGQRQKIAIARMLLFGTKVLIFDEATSAIDNYSRERIAKAIHDNYSDRLIIIIGHRLNTIRSADHIYYIGDRRILEEGPPQELERRKGLTHDLLLVEPVGVTG